MTNTVTTYAEADALLGKRSSRKVANNTYVQRRGDAIAVRLHDTDVVRWHADGTIILDSGGWYTQTTRDRINAFIPNAVRIFTHKGRWMVDLPPRFVDGDKPSAVAYRDKMALQVLTLFGKPVVTTGDYLPWSEVERQDRHNRRVDKLLDAYLRAYGDLTYCTCGMCTRVSPGVMAGDHFDYPQHLLEHLVNREMSNHLIAVATDYHGRDTKRALRAYLRARLYVGAVSTAHGRKPIVLPPTALEAS